MPTLKYRDPADGQWKAVVTGPTDHAGLTGRGDDDHTQYLNAARGDAAYLRRSGGQVNHLGINERASRDQWGGGVLIHAPGVSWARLKSGHDGAGGYHLRVEDGHQQDVPIRVQAAYPTTDNHAATVQYTQDVWAPRIQGPHGGNWGYQDVVVGTYVAMVGGAIYQAPYNEPGLFKCYASCYLHISGATATADMYFGLVARWSDGNTGTFTNGGVVVRSSRLTVPAAQQRGYLHGVAEGWIENRPGHGLIWAGAASRGGSSGAPQFGGQYRLTSEFWPYAATFGGLNIGWHSW